MDFKILKTTLGDVLFRRDRDADYDPIMVISWFDAQDTQHSMSLGFPSTAVARNAIASATAEFAETWVQKQANLFA